METAIAQYSLSNEELLKLQAVELELIAEVDRICKKNGISYLMVGGTMLGAIRHKGFIPWDDDADIGFLRSEYDRFLKACAEDLDHEKFFVQDCRQSNGYRWGYGKLRRKGSEFVRLGQEHMPYSQCISIDLMPFDGVPDNWLLRRIHYFMCFVFRKIFWSEVGKKNEKNCILRALYQLLSFIPEKFIYKRYQRFIDFSNKRERKLVRILTFPTPKKCFGYCRKWYVELAEYEFEKLKLPGARDYDDYLTVKYGKYMELPPKEKQKVHPVSKLSFPEE